MTWQALGTFIKDWIPPIGILVGGIWIFFKWYHGEKLRKQKERTAVDGELIYQSFSLSEDKYILIFNAHWDNKSPLPFKADTHNSGLDIFKINNNIPLGGLDLRVNKETLGDAVVEVRPFQKLKSLVIEPNAQANFQHMAVLEKGYIYLARYKLYRATDKGKFSRTRLCILDLR
jgi:hypothetical protein